MVMPMIVRMLVIIMMVIVMIVMLRIIVMFRIRMVVVVVVMRLGVVGLELRAFDGVCRLRCRLPLIDAFVIDAVLRQRDLRRIFHHFALHALAIAAAARVAVPWAAAAAGAVFTLLLGLAMGALIRLDQRLPVGDRNLIIVGMDFAEGEETVAVAAIFDEGRLQRRLNARDLGEVDVAAQLFALGGLEIKLFDAIAADHNDPGLFRVGGIDQHFVGHFGTLDGGGRVSR
jgi:hypothetical protein